MRGDFMEQNLERAEAIIDAYGCEQSNLIAIMQDIQTEYKYLSPEVLERIAEKLDVGVAKVYSVATFYENFSLEAKGKYIIKVCDGTACHVQKSQPIYTAIREYLELEGKQKTSADGLFTLETVACLGACGLAPVVTVNDKVHSKMTPELAIELLEELKKEKLPYDDRCKTDPRAIQGPPAAGQAGPGGPEEAGADLRRHRLHRRRLPGDL